MPTNKEILEQIRNGQEDMAKKHLNFSSSVSIFMNEQKLLNAKLTGYLENDSKTNQKGGMEQIADNRKDIQLLKTQRRIAYGVVTTMGVIGGVVLKAIGFFKA